MMEETLMLLENPRRYNPRRRRRRRRNPSQRRQRGQRGLTFKPSALTTGLGICGVAYFCWMLYNWRETGLWSWTPWRSTTSARRLLGKTLGKPLGGTLADTVPYQATRVHSGSSVTVVRPGYGEQETISLITP